jgi:endonuclease
VLHLEHQPTRPVGDGRRRRSCRVAAGVAGAPGHQHERGQDAGQRSASHLVRMPCHRGDPRRRRPVVAGSVPSVPVRLVIARCSVDYVGRLTAHLPMASRLLLVKADGSVSVHADDRAYKPLNWMTPPCSFKDELVSGPDGASGTWTITNKAGEQLIITIESVEHDSSHELGVDPGLQKDGVEAELQRLLALHVETFGQGWSLVRREYPTAIGPVDLLCRDADGATVAVEVKRRGEIDGVEQLTRYLELLNRDPLLAPVRGVFAAQEIKPQARVLAGDRGIECLTVDYAVLKGTDDPTQRLF